MMGKNMLTTLEIDTLIHVVSTKRYDLQQKIKEGHGTKTYSTLDNDLSLLREYTVIESKLVMMKDTF